MSNKEEWLKSLTGEDFDFMCSIETRDTFAQWSLYYNLMSKMIDRVDKEGIILPDGLYSIIKGIVSEVELIKSPDFDGTLNQPRLVVKDG